MIFYYKNVSFADFTHKKIYVRICVNVCKVNICEYMCMNFTNVLFSHASVERPWGSKHMLSISTQDTTIK